MIFRPGEPTNERSGVGDLKLDWRRGNERNIMSKFANRFFLGTKIGRDRLSCGRVYPTVFEKRERNRDRARAREMITGA